MARGNLMMRLLPIFKQRSANPIGDSATLKCLEPGQVLKVKNEPGDQNIPIDAVHSLVREVAALGLHHSCSSRPPVWVPLVKQKGPSKSKAPAINTPPISSRLPRKAKTEALAKQRQRISQYDYNDDDDFEDGPPPFKAPKSFKFDPRDVEKAHLEKAKRDSLLDNLMHSNVVPARASGNNNDVVGKISRKSQESLELFIPGSPGITVTRLDTKRTDEEEVKILEVVPSPDNRKVKETSVSTSRSFNGSCPLCHQNFEDQGVLQTHASTCDGPTQPEVK